MARTRSELDITLASTKMFLKNLKLKKIEANNTAYDELIAETEADIQALNDQIAATGDDEGDANAAYVLNLKISYLNSVMRSVKVFSAGSTVETFLEQVESKYKIEVVPELAEHPTMETAFVKCCLNLLDRNIWTQYDHSGEKVTTFAEFKAYMAKSHGSKKSIYQHLSRCWDLEQKPGEKIVTYSARLDSIMREAVERIKVKFVEDHKTENNPTPTMTVDNLASVVAGMLISEQIKKNSPNIYTHLCKKIDRLYTPIAIGEECQLFVDRGVKETEGIVDDVVH